MIFKAQGRKPSPCRVYALKKAHTLTELREDTRKAGYTEPMRFLGKGVNMAIYYNRVK